MMAPSTVSVDDELHMDPSKVSALLDRLANLDNCDTSEESISTIIRSILPHSQLLEANQSQVFVDALDKAMILIRTDTELYQKCLRALRKVCGARGLLPSSYLLSTGLTKKTDYAVASGGFADVWEGTYGGRCVAIKSVRIYLSANLTEIRKTFYKEVVIWKQLSHPNVVPFLGVSEVLFPLCMISEWMPHGDITAYVKVHPDINRLRLLVDVCKGLRYLHSFNIVHRDLKGANILVNSSEQACISDFGLTSVVSDLTTMNASTSQGHDKGTCRWMAPELFDEGNDHGVVIMYSAASDIYALAMVIFEVFSGKPPFEELQSNLLVMLKVLEGTRPKRPNELREVGLSDEVWRLVELSWRHEREMRPSISFLLSHLRAATPGISVLERLEDFDPNSAESIDVLGSVLESSTDKTKAADMTSENYVALIEILYRAMESPLVVSDLRRRCVLTIAKIYGHTHLPSSYLLVDSDSRRRRVFTLAKIYGPADFDPAKESSIERIRSVLNTQTDMDLLLGCHELDAIIVIDVLDRVIGSKLSDPVLAQKALRAVSKLWECTLLLPSSYQLSGGLKKTQEKQVGSWVDYWKIWKGTCDGRPVAIKSYNETKVTLRKMFLRNAVFPKRLSHRNILPFLGVSSTLYPSCVVLPWMENGNIFHYSQANPYVDRLPLIIDVAEGLQYLHSLNIIHGNMKCTNVLINDEERACISSFEMAVIRNPLAPDEDDPDEFCLGAVQYMAPEIVPFRGSTWRSMATDIYSLAMILIWIYSDINPFSEIPVDEMMDHISGGGRPERPGNSLEIGLTDDLWELAWSCLDKDPNKRPKIQTVLEQLKKIRKIGPYVPFTEPLSGAIPAGNSSPSSITDLDSSENLSSVSRSPKGAKTPSKTKRLLSLNSLRSSRNLASESGVDNSDQNSEGSGTPTKQKKKSPSIFARLRP